MGFMVSMTPSAKVTAGLAVAVLMSGCLSRYSPQTRKADDGKGDLIEKNAEQSPQPKFGSKTPGSGSEDETRARVPSLENQRRFLAKHLKPGSSFTKKDHDFVSRLPDDPAAGSLTEATLALGLVKTVLNPLHLDTPTFSESEISESDAGSQDEDPDLQALSEESRFNEPNQPKPEGEAKRGAFSLVTLSQERGIDFPRALAKNPWLAGVGVAQQTWQALQRHETNGEFRRRVEEILKHRTNTWANLQRALGEGTPLPGEDDTGTDMDAGGHSGSAPGNTAPNPAALRGGDSLLTEAQKLAEGGNYQDAIRKAKQIPASSPMSEAAQEKIKEFSNLAVQDLRRKAAQAFRDAMPVTDSRTRAQYLERAKNYLETAIKEYPDATQLPRVRENLRVISRDLKRLKGDAGTSQQG